MESFGARAHSTPIASITCDRDPHDPDARLFLHYGDLSDGTGLRRVLERVQADDEIYHLGAQSHVRVSFDEPEYTADVDATGTRQLA